VVALLFLLLKGLLESSLHAATIAFLTALLFAAHPMHTEAVASIVGRSELLAVGFLLAAWLLHLHDRQDPVLLCFLLASCRKNRRWSSSRWLFLGITHVASSSPSRAMPGSLVSRRREAYTVDKQCSHSSSGRRSFAGDFD